MEKPKFGPALNESVLRMAFLEQAANLLNTQSNDASPTCGLLGNLLLREMKEVGNVDQLRMHRDFKRSFCKRCFKNWLPDNTGKAPFKIKENDSKMIAVICKSCQNEKRLALTPKYESRNEKAGHMTD